MTEKRTKDDVHYTPRAAKISERCRYCQHFMDTHLLYGECEKVKGNISPHGWCDLFKRKEKSGAKSAA